MPFLPLHDKNPRILIDKPWVTWGMILLAVVIFFYQVQLHEAALEDLAYGLGIIPITLTGEAQLAPELYLVPPVATLITSIFLHADLMHLVGNMAYLWVFGDNIEDAMGHFRFLVFYLLCGIAAGLCQTAIDPASEIPTIGASGAISGVLGGYLVLHPKARILVPIIIIPVYLPAYLLLLFWIGFQVFSATQLGPDGNAVAWWAHIGGFFAGMVLVVFFRRKTIPLFGGDLYPRGLRMAVRERHGKEPQPEEQPRRPEQEPTVVRKRPWER